jgi:hypothetical protein
MRRQLARHVVEEVDDAVDRGLAPFGIAGNDGADLDQRAQSVDPGGAVKQSVGAAIQEDVLDLGPGQAVTGLQRTGQPRPVQVALGVLANGFDGHSPASFLVKSPSATSRSAQPCQLSNWCVRQPRRAAAVMLSARSSVKISRSGGRPQSSSTDW